MRLRQAKKIAAAFCRERFPWHGRNMERDATLKKALHSVARRSEVRRAFNKRYGFGELAHGPISIVSVAV